MSFYEVLAQLSVTLLGLWWVVVQVRESRAPSDADERRLASAVSLHLAVPALMSLCSLADPDHNALWRWSFGALGTFGLVHLVATAARRPGAVTGLGPVGPVAVGLGVVIYGAVVAVAALAGPIVDLAWELRPVEIEALLLTGLLALQLVVAVRLLFAPVRPRPRPGTPPRSAS